MKDIRTGDQSGGLKPEHGGSTPTKTGEVGGGDSAEVVTTTDDKNAPGAFAQQPESSDKSESIQNSSDHERDGDNLNVAQY